MNRIQNENGFDAQITNGESFRFAFRNFQASIASWSTPACICIDWKNQNGTSDGAIRYLIDRAVGNVTVSGDYGTAVAHWDTELTPEKLYQFTDDASYFTEKLRCATDRYEFSPQAANEDLDVIASESHMEGAELQTTLDY